MWKPPQKKPKQIEINKRFVANRVTRLFTMIIYNLSP